MGLNVGEYLSAESIIDLKAKVKAEMTRRQWGAGPLTEYAGTDYDYTITPETGGAILEEHARKIIVPLDAITNQGYSYTSGSLAKEMQTQLARVTAYATEGQCAPASGSSCSANCSGLCTGCSGCTNCTSCAGCTACTNKCSGCTDVCRNTCNGCRGCTGDCGGSCGGTCGSSGGPGFCG